ncbi:DUF692 domain-containing protein [Fastidiosibacter lacustris]|uniref:HvfB family MNIO-type RiPP peptide maturase n=1 Tax=Fastidiosibacter lacustris TaxID=2056695 RepID=UPI000E34D765|nr:DUF692 domain-containing protein [Fastidiosibacter lacustris]
MTNLTIHHKAIGLGLRQEFFNTLLAQTDIVDFIEIAPENWLGMGGKRKHLLNQYLQKLPIVLHGLNLSIGSIAPLNIKFIKSIKAFMREYNILIYSEHLSFCSDAQGYLYDLLPLPFHDKTIKHVVMKIKQVQDIIEQPLVLENISYYAAPIQVIKEIDFLNIVIQESGCQLLLDVNNVYVNSINHGYNPYTFIDQLPTNKICYIHIAGHCQKTDSLIIDTHGEDVNSSVWQLLQYTYQTHGFFPTLLERDFNIPNLLSLQQELSTIKSIHNRCESKVFE